MNIFDAITRLPLQYIGLTSIPAIPIQLDELPDTFFNLLLREIETVLPKYGLSTTYTIDGETATAYEFLYGKTSGHPLVDARNRLKSLVSNPANALALLHDQAFGQASPLLTSNTADPLTTLPLDTPEQFALSWTTFQDVYQSSIDLIPSFAASLKDIEHASSLFWPTIAQYGLGYNLLILQKVRAAQLASLKNTFQTIWTSDLDALYINGRLYAIDMSIFKTVKPLESSDLVRFTPATITLLKQDPQTKDLTPIAIRVSGYQDRNAQIYTSASASLSAWLYALQAAKTSITVYGIWLGHVYHWHIVTAAMQMTMYNTVPNTHPLYLLLAPQSNNLIAFDNILILLWDYIAPPTSISSGFQFFELANTFATDRVFFDDDPKTTLDRLGLQVADFTSEKPWDKYPIVQYLLTIWDATEEYITAFVNTTYPQDADVARDQALQTWIRASSDASAGNIKGLPAMNSKAALTQVLTSLIYRITAHGTARLNATANPGLTFVANFPPCLQQTSIPATNSEFDTKKLLEFLPTTGTIGQMVTFYFTFVFSLPYQPFLPFGGADTLLFFGTDVNDPRNQALIRYRNAIGQFIKAYDSPPISLPPQMYQWPLNIET